jgi:hypothetical protein
MEPKDSLSRLQEPASDSYFVPDEFNPHSETHFPEIHLTLSSNLPNGLFPLGFSTKILCHFSIPHVRLHVPPI